MGVRSLLDAEQKHVTLLVVSSSHPGAAAPVWKKARIQPISKRDDNQCLTLNITLTHLYHHLRTKHDFSFYQIQDQDYDNFELLAIV